jgi:hypothetical protein
MSKRPSLYETPNYATFPENTFLSLFFCQKKKICDFCAGESASRIHVSVFVCAFDKVGPSNTIGINICGYLHEKCYFLMK